MSDNNMARKHLLGVSVILSVLLVGTLSLPSQAESITFKNGSYPTVAYNGTDSTSLFPGDPNGNYGADPYLHLGYSTSDRRALIRFDVSALSGQYSQINSITLNLYTHTDYGSDTLLAYQVTSANASWIAGTGNGTLVAGAATWADLANPSTPWADSPGLGTPGIDYVNTLLASAAYTISTPLNAAVSLNFTGSPAALTTLINTWLTAGQNGGLLLRNNNTGEIDPYSSAPYNTVNTPSYTPALIITYTPIPEPASLGLRE
jgi:hypothetical protein